jgi:hypothetical protein
MLPASARPTTGTDVEVLVVDDQLQWLRLYENSHRHRGRMDAATLVGFRYTLPPMATCFVLKESIGLGPEDTQRRETRPRLDEFVVKDRGAYSA